MMTLRKSRKASKSVRVLNVAEQSILFGLGASLLLMGIATLGCIEPAIGSTLKEVVDFALILIALWGR